MNRYWICGCGSINDDLDILCRSCKKSPILTAIAFPHFASEEDLLKWIQLARTKMGAKVFRKGK